MAAQAGGDPKLIAEAERIAVEKYVKERGIEQAVQDLVQSLLQAKPRDPKKWLLHRIEQELSDESDDLSESELQRLFTVSRRITAEIVPQETISIVISETLQLLNCDTVSLFVLDRKSSMLRLYASNLENPIMVKLGQGIAGSVFESKETVNIADCYQDSRFDRSFDTKSGYMTKSLIAVPILDFDGSSLGVIQAINKLPKKDEFDDTPDDPDEPPSKAKPAGLRAVPFKRNDEKMLLHLTQHVGIAMRNAEVYREAISSSERATGLLNTIQSLSQDLGTQSLLLTITMHANKIVSAQRSTVFLVDEANQQLWSVSTDTGQEIRIPKRAGIAGQCCCEGVLINIPDAYADARFNQEIDRKTGFRTHSILAVPIFQSQTKDKDGVVGVIQMINKVSYDGQLECFDEADIQVMELFASFVGPKLSNSALLSGHKVEREVEVMPQTMTADSNHEERSRQRSSVLKLAALGEEPEGDE